MPFIAIAIVYRKYRAGHISLRAFLRFVLNMFQYLILHITLFFLNMWGLYVVIGHSTRPTNTITCTNTTSVVVNLPKYQEVRNIPRWREAGAYRHEYSEARMVKITGSVWEYVHEPVVRGTSGVYGVERAQGQLVHAFPALHGARGI
jgi:hypothetical protein